MKLIFLFLLNNINAYTMPPINVVYKKNIYIPLVGSQIIKTEMITQNKAKIKLMGIVNTEGLAYYYKKNKEINIRLSKELAKLMEELKCNFSDPNYDPKKDEISFKLYIKPIYFNKKIILKKELST